MSVILDESQTAFRTQATLLAAEVGHNLVWDVTILGSNCSQGLPFGALILARGGGPTAPIQPKPLACAIAIATFDAASRDPWHRRLATLGTALRERFVSQCEAHDLDANTTGPAAGFRVHFAGQENADASLMLHHFGLELGAVGIGSTGTIYADVRLESQRDELLDRLSHATSRMRTLLIEHNSYLCGGLPYPFATGSATLRDRGVARYRYPNTGPTTVEVEDAGVRIRFESGPLGPITSSGFYVPTRVIGDFDISVRYAIEQWQPGPDSACLALFVQNELSTARYYAQRMSVGTAPDRHEILASFCDRLFEAQPIQPLHGWFRLQRRGSRLSAAHRTSPEAPWLELGADDHATLDPVIIGAKIWSKIECGGLVAHLTELTVDGEVPNEQFPPMEPRPDPRRA